MSTGLASPNAAEVPTIESALEHAKRAFALRKYEQAVDHYATALELMTTTHGEDAPQAADLYFAYGKALLENAIAQSSVLGKAEDAVSGGGKEDEASGSGAFLSFSGDVDDDNDSPTEDQALDLFTEATKAVEEEEEEDSDEDAEPEDDFNAAWEVLDLARAIYEKGKDEDDGVKLKLADTFIALGDVSLETEKFDQAISDYSSGLALKNDLLSLSSRQIAEAHYKLSIVLDLTSGRLGDSITHAERALESVEARLAEIRNGLNGQIVAESKPDIKGKGKATGLSLVEDDAVSKMSTEQMTGELRELEGLKEDLALKVEELKTSPDHTEESAPALAAKALDKELNNAATSPVPPQVVVNDLTGIVKKKKKVPETSNAGKRKAEGDAADGSVSPSEKKPKLDEEVS